jgi:hypothetical protein
MHVFWNAWSRVDGDGGPNFLAVRFRDPVASQKIPGGCILMKQGSDDCGAIR